MKDQENITEVDQYVIDFVRDLRNKQELTQEDIANIIHVSRSFIRDVESPNRSSKYNIRHVNALADYFGISPREFVPEKAFQVISAKKENPKKAAPKKKTVSKSVPVKQVKKSK
jgi:transcriptional regulator with XRE-family HTH domain